MAVLALGLSDTSPLALIVVPMGKQRGALAQGGCGKAWGGSGRGDAAARAMEGGKPQQSTISSVHRQAGFAQGQYISPL